MIDGLTPEEQVTAKLDASGGSVAVVTPERGADGKFIAKPATPEVDDADAATAAAVAAAAGEEVPKAENEGKEDDAPVVDALTIESDAVPVYGHDGKFEGGKLFNKYETIDEQIVGHRNALKRIGQLEHDLADAKKTPPTVGGPLGNLYIPDVSKLTEDQITKLVLDQMGDGEVTFDEKSDAYENPGKFAAKHVVKVNRILKQIEQQTAAWDDLTKKAYPTVFDRAKPHGVRVFEDYKVGKIGPAEFILILGLGEMSRNCIPSGEKDITRIKHKSTGRDAATAATTAVPVPEKEDPRAVQKAKLKEMSDAAY